MPAISSDEYKIVDTIGAGDTYTGYFAVRYMEIEKSKQVEISRKDKIEESMKFATAAGFLAITKEGAMPSIPVRGEVLALSAKYFNKT